MKKSFYWAALLLCVSCGADDTDSEKGPTKPTNPVTPENPVNSSQVITYTSSNDYIVQPTVTSGFGANLISNTYEEGVGKMVFDGPVTTIGPDTFDRCFTLTGITLPNTIRTIEEGAFNTMYLEPYN